MKIGKKLILAFLIVSLSALAVAGILSYTIAKSSITERVLDHLESVATIQKNRLDGMIDQNLERLALVASRTQLRLSLKMFNEKPEQAHQDKMNRILRDAKASIACFREISVLDLKGKVVASTNAESAGESHANEEYFPSGQKRSRADMLYLNEKGELSLRLSGPLLLEGELIGVLVIEADADKFIVLAGDYSGLGRTGETLLLMENGAGRMMFITPTRFDRDAALKKTMSMEKRPASAATGVERVVRALDYRGEPVLQVAEHVEETGWLLVVKIDRAEAFAPVTGLGAWLLAGMLIAAVVVALVSFYLARSITKPVASLTRATKKVAEGDFSFRVKVASDDEVGTLATAFNEMSRELEESQRILTTLMANLPGMAYRCMNDKDWTMEFVSEGSLALTGYEPSDLIGNSKVSYAQLIHPDDVEMVWDKVQAALERKEPFELEYRIGTADGAQKWVWEQGRGIFSAEGELLSLEGFITDITERKLAEERLIHLNAVLRAIRNVNQLITKERDREKLLKDICDALTEHRDYPCAWIVAMDASGKFVTVAGAGLEDAFHAFPEHLKSKEPIGCVKKVLEQAELLAVTSLPFDDCLDCPLSGKYPELGVFTVRMEYGSRVHGVLAAYVNKAFVEDEEEQSLLLEVASDVALALDKMEQEKSLQKSEEKYRNILESVNDLIQSVAPDGTILYVNRGWRETLGYSEEDVAKLSLFDVIHPDSMAHCQEMFKHVLSGETVTGAEAVFVAKDGRQVIVEGSASCRFVNGEPVATMGIFRDVTERKQAQEALRESEEKYRLIYATAGDAIMTLEPPDWRFTSGNNKIVEMFGVKDEEEFISLTPWQISPENQPDGQLSEVKAKKMIEIAMKEGENYFEWTHKRVRGEEFFATVLLNRVDVKGKAFLQARVTDITERKKAEEAARELEAQKLVVEELRRLDQMKDEFVSIITHELRTPMTPIKSSVELFLDGTLGEVTEQQKKYLDMMKRNIDRLAQFTTEVLSLSRLQAGRYAVNPEMLSVSEVADSAVELLREKAQGKDSTIKLDIGAELQAYADANALAQVLTNLVNNAIVHAGDGAEIVLSGGKHDGDFVEVSVADNGHGIPEEALPHLFDRFYQADRKKAPGYQGTGIGLSLCKGLVEAMSGVISVESQKGEGTIFRFTLPASPPEKNLEEVKK